jgi:hypothetical protein
MGVVLKAMAKILVKDSNPIDVGCMRGEVEFSAKDSDSKGNNLYLDVLLQNIKRFLMLLEASELGVFSSCLIQSYLQI